MTSVYCSKGHENPSSSRFCLHCGEKLDTPIHQSIQPGQTLGDRYLIVRQIGQGGFGRTYLAEDINRFRESCVLKEFSPQVQTAYVLQKAEELFQREATVLYKLQHPQIPRFRELFRSSLHGKEYLFLVQDYVEGKTYRSLLDERLQQGLRFSETEVRQLLQQLLPVLEYIHSLGVIHRDISPDNLILRNIDQLPVLIDFGGVKQVAAVVVSEYYQPDAGKVTPPATLLGKFGYAPPEQMQAGIVEPHSDLYALAVTVLVLLTGKQPSELIDNYTITWQWRREINLSPTLGAVLDKMLSPIPGERYQNARQVLQALNPTPVNNYVPTQPSTPIPVPEPPTSATLAVAPAVTPTPDAPWRVSTLPTPPQNKTWWTPGKIVLVLLLVMGAFGVSYWGVNNLISSRPGDPDDNTPRPTPTVSPTKQPVDPLAKYSPEERARKERLRDRRQRLGIDENFYFNVVNQIFWDKNPSLQKRSLSDEPADAELRKEWDNTAQELLQKVTLLSSEARRRLGTYGSADRDRWKVEVNNLNVSSRALYDLGDAAFLQQFPEQQGKNFIDQPIGQIWHGLVSDKLNAILARSAFQKVAFDSGASSKTVSGNLKGANGKVFIAELAQNQLMEVKLEANSRILWSIYSPTGQHILLEDSKQRSWSGKLPESGYYEFVIVSQSSQALDYQLNLTVENPTPTPSPTPTPTPTPTDTPTSSPSPTPTETPTPSPTPTPTETTTSTPEPTSTP